MRKRTLFSAVLLAATALGLGATASAQSVQSWAVPPRAGGSAFERVQSNARSLREIVDMVRRQRGGELVDVLQFEQSANPPFYVLRWRFENGVVADLRVNAQTGQIM